MAIRTKQLVHATVTAEIPVYVDLTMDQEFEPRSVPLEEVLKGEYSAYVSARESDEDLIFVGITEMDLRYGAHMDVVGFFYTLRNKKVKQVLWTTEILEAYEKKDPSLSILFFAEESLGKKLLEDYLPLGEKMGKGKYTGFANQSISDFHFDNTQDVKGLVLPPAATESLFQSKIKQLLDLREAFGAEQDEGYFFEPVIEEDEGSRKELELVNIIEWLGKQYPSLDYGQVVDEIQLAEKVNPAKI